MKLKIEMVFKFSLFLALTVAVTLIPVGCVTQSEADARARIAFLEGQNQALMRMQGIQPTPSQAEPAQTGAAVTFVGSVKNLIVPWRLGLMLSQAIVGAQYNGPGDPTAIIIHRDGMNIPINPKGLLNGEDFGLQVDDVIEIRP